jgi:hypothetical protein
MAESLTLQLPTDVAERARALAAATNKRIEDIVVEWIGLGAAETPVELLPDSAIVELSRSQLPDVDQQALSELFGRQSILTTAERVRLNELVAKYRRGLIVKARATKEAVSRGLIYPLNGDAA